MMALKCDNCGGYFDLIGDGKTPNYVRISNMDEFGKLTYRKSFNICPACLAAMMKALDDRKRRTVDPMEDDLK